MNKIKIFKGLESDYHNLESQVNQWLASSDSIRVVNISGNISPQSFSKPKEDGGFLSQSSNAPSDILIIVHYQEG